MKKYSLGQWWRLILFGLALTLFWSKEINGLAFGVILLLFLSTIDFSNTD